MQEPGKMVIEEQEEDQAYVADTSLPLRTLYQMLLDLYDNAYPIPFIAFRRTFDRYMKVTKDNLIDAVVLLIYGAGSIKHIGTGEETISVDRIRDETNYPEDVKEVHSPFYRFIDGDDEVRIGYDYAVVMDFIDHENKEIRESKLDMEELIETYEKIKTRVLPRFPMLINPCEMKLEFEFPEGKYSIVDLKNFRFTTVMKEGKLYDLDGKREIELQPVPAGCVGVKSYLYDEERTFITILDDGKQFCYDTRYSRFDLISEDGTVDRSYVVGA